MDRISTKQLATLPIEFKLNGKTVIGRPDEPIIETARQNGISIPHLCYSRTLRPDGNCRACVVEVKGERVLAPSCCRFPTQGMEVTTDSPRALASQKMVIELLLSDMPEKRYTKVNKVDGWARKLGVGLPRFEARVQPKADISHPGIAVNLVACGECVQVCPTGALMPAREAGLEVVDKKVDSVCPFCGVGCQLTYHVKKSENVIKFVTGRDGPANHGRLCVKGRYGFDYVQHPQRLTKPLIRKAGIPKTAHFTVDPANWKEAFREASWEEA